MTTIYKPLRMDGSDDPWAEYPESINPNTDGIESAGFYPQNATSNDSNAGVERDASGNLILKDANAGSVKLSDLMGDVLNGFVAGPSGVTAWYALYISGSGAVSHALANSYTTSDVLGFALATTAAGAPVNILSGGPVTPVKESTQTWTPGDTIYLSTTTPGAVTNVPPSGTNNVLQPVGIAKDSSSMVIAIGTPVILA